jgi:hypothetical protein
LWSDENEGFALLYAWEKSGEVENQAEVKATGNFRCESLRITRALQLKNLLWRLRGKPTESVFPANFPFSFRRFFSYLLPKSALTEILVIKIFLEIIVNV